MQLPVSDLVHHLPVGFPSVVYPLQLRHSFAEQVPCLIAAIRALLIIAISHLKWVTTHHVLFFHSKKKIPSSLLQLFDSLDSFLQLFNFGDERCLRHFFGLFLQ